MVLRKADLDAVLVMPRPDLAGLIHADLYGPIVIIRTFSFQAVKSCFNCFGHGLAQFGMVFIPVFYTAT
jgi:hypothetical protein